MQSFICPICGGQLKIVIGAETAECDSCGRMTALRPEDVQKYREIYLGAERAMRQSNVAGYREALEKLDSISFVEEARKKKAFCEQRLSKLEAMQRQRQVSVQKSDAKSAKLGIVLLIVALLFVAAAIAGVVYFVIAWRSGMLSRTTIVCAVAAAVIAAVLLLIGRLRSGG